MRTVFLSNFLGALPARFRRQRVLIVGCGDVGLRVARVLQGAGGGTRTGIAATAVPHAPRVRVLALTSSPDRVALLRAAGSAQISSSAMG